ncbi:MAG: type II secretion system protein GspG [Candidatus Polarisedimenticolia bacterium]
MLRDGRQAGFTLIELLIVVAIIGLIAAIAIPNLMTAMDAAKQKKSMADMKSLHQAIERYQIDVNNYPISTSMATIESLGSSMGLEPDYIAKAPARDGWGGPYFYGSDAGGSGSDYTIMSYGKDHKLSPGSVGQTHDFDCDIIFQNGVFTAAPEGAQK